MTARFVPALAIAVAVHGVIVVVASIEIPDLDDDEPATVITAAATPAQATPPVSTEFEITFLPSAAIPSTTPSTPMTPAAPTTEAPRRTAITTGRSAPGTEKVATASGTATEPGTTSEPGTRSPLMDMRKGRDPLGRGRNPLGLSGRMIEREDPVDPLRDPSVPSTGMLEPAGGGRFRADRGTFVAHVAPDGKVSFNDKRNLQHQFTSIENVKKTLRESGPFGLLRVDFDVNDAIMRASGNGDPYSSAKLKFLDDTREERFQIGVAHRAAVRARTDEIVQGNLAHAWRTLTNTPARKQALFDLWDECEEDADDRAPGEKARRAVIGFIRGKLPAGSADAYTAAELAKLNASRRSKRPFAPYE